VMAEGRIGAVRDCMGAERGRTRLGNGGQGASREREADTEQEEREGGRGCGEMREVGGRRRKEGGRGQ
jgi:hypothetical protein